MNDDTIRLAWLDCMGPTDIEPIRALLATARAEGVQAGLEKASALCRRLARLLPDGTAAQSQAFGCADSIDDMAERGEEVGVGAHGAGSLPQDANGPQGIRPAAPSSPPAPEPDPRRQRRTHSHYCPACKGTHECDDDCMGRSQPAPRWTPPPRPRRRCNNVGVVQSIDYESFPQQGSYLGKRVCVCFKYDTTHEIGGVVVRDDAEDPGVEIIRLDDGRYVLSTECQYSLEQP